MCLHVAVSAWTVPLDQIFQRSKAVTIAAIRISCVGSILDPSVGVITKAAIIA